MAINPTNNVGLSTGLDNNEQRKLTSRNGQKKVNPAVAPNQEEVVSHENINTDDLRKNLKKIEKEYQSVSRKLEFIVHEESGEVVINVYDRETDQLIRQIPSEEMLKRIETMNDINNILFETKI